jgi:GT2 family glycosyltransferase
MTSPFLTIVVLTYNTRDLVLRCLENFYSLAIRWGWQIIVVDNGSTDGTDQAVTEKFPAVELIRSERNLGFAAGINLGLQRAVGQVIVLMNSDVLTSAETLKAAAEALLAQPGVGALSPLLRAPDGKPQAFAFGKDQSPGYLLMRGLKALLGLGPMHHWDVKGPLEVDWVSGACMLVRLEVIQQVGPLDERFFLYFEDNDWCLRMRKSGWRVLYDPRFEVIHLGGTSLPQRYQASQIYHQSLIQFTAKHYGPLKAEVVRILLSGYRALHRMLRSKGAFFQSPRERH